MTQRFRGASDLRKRLEMETPMMGTHEHPEAPRWPDLLDQNLIWIDAQGRTLPLDDMEPRHCRNLHAMLLRMSGRYLESLSWSMMSGPGPSGDMACDAFDSEMDRLHDAMAAPEEWMKQQPLLIALRRRINGETARPAETQTETETDLFMETPATKETPDWRAQLREGPQQYGRLTELAQRIIALDDIDGPGTEERRTVTLTTIIDWAREALDGNKPDTLHSYCLSHGRFHTYPYAEDRAACSALRVYLQVETREQAIALKNKYLPGVEFYDDLLPHQQYEIEAHDRVILTRDGDINNLP